MSNKNIEITLSVNGPSEAMERYQTWIDRATDEAGDVFFADIMLAAGATCVRGNYCDCLWHFIVRDVFLTPEKETVTEPGDIQTVTSVYRSSMNFADQLTRVTSLHPQLTFDYSSRERLLDDEWLDADAFLIVDGACLQMI